MEKYPERVIARLTKKQAALLEEIAVKRRMTVSQILRRLIEEEYDRDISKT